MAITLNAVGTLDGTFAATLNPGLPAGFAADDIHVCVVTLRGNDVLTFPAGWTQKITQNDGGSHRLVIAWKRAVGGDTTPAITGSATNAAIARIAGFRGCITTGDPFDASGVQANASSATLTAPTITTLNADDMVLFIGSCFDTGPASHSFSGYSGTNPTFNETFDSSSNPGVGFFVSMFMAHGIKTDAAATGSRTATINTAEQNIGALLSLIAAGGAAPDSPPVSGAIRQLGPILAQ